MARRLVLEEGHNDLDTHITDILNVLEYEDLHDVRLVGHSYAGLIITGVARRSAHLLAHLVYLDALLLMDGARSWAALIQQRQPAIAAVAESQIKRVETYGCCHRRVVSAYSALWPLTICTGYGNA